MIKKTIRNFKVQSQSYYIGTSYTGTSTLALTIRGAWLEEWGFEEDTPIAVYCENDKLTIVKQDYKKRVRKMKVYGQYCQKKKVATIRLKGHWLRKWGFDRGTSVAMQCEYGKLTITKKGAEEKED